MAKVLEQQDFLRFIAGVKPKKIGQVIDAANNEQILSLCEIAHNVLQGNVKLSPREFNKLEKYKNLIRKLGCKKIGVPAKRRALVQKGGNFLIPLLLSAVGPLVGKIFGG